MTSALKLATQGAELEAERARTAMAVERSKATAKLFAQCALASAAIITSIGVAIWLANQRRVVEIKQIARAPEEISSQIHLSTQPPSVPDVPANKIKMNVTQFNSIAGKDLKLANPYLSALTAGHEYNTSNSDRWDHAWCYADFRRDGITHHVELELRRGTTALTMTISENEQRQLLLSPSDANFLRAHCPWKPQ